MAQVTIAILTVENDLHAFAVQHALREFQDLTCLLVDTDCISGSGSCSWLIDSCNPMESSIRTHGGMCVSTGGLDVIWWRRTNYPQKISADIVDLAHLDLVNNDCSAALLGTCLTDFRGIWINDPIATRNAENKLVQLKAAREAGLVIPRTLVSNDPHKIRGFCDSLDNQVVVKPVRGTTQCHLFTRVVTPEHLDSDDCLELCPATYQELIPGRQHLRVHCFGDHAEAVLIESDAIDWRQNLDIPFIPFTLSTTLKSALLSVVRNLGLLMGVIDLKLSTASTPVWLEVNPQGQFLFSEALSGVDLTRSFAEFLYQQALIASQRRFRGNARIEQVGDHNSIGVN